MTDKVREVLIDALREDLKDQDGALGTICIVFDADSLGATIANITGDISLKQLSAACLRALKAAGLTIEPDWNTDMDAAPKDGTRIMLYECSKYIPFIGYWGHVGRFTSSPKMWIGHEFGAMEGGSLTAWKPITPYEGG